MSNNRLRELGYSSEDGRVITCHREVGRRNEHRYDHERCGVVRIDLDTKSGRDLTEKLIAAIDEPAALIGRDRRGGAVMLFRVGEHSDLPHTADDGISRLITPDGELVTITYGSVDQMLDVGAWSWVKGRSPLDVRRSDLAVLFADIYQRAVDAAFKLGCAHAPSAAQRAAAERVSKIKQGLADGTLKPTDRQAEEDDHFLAQNRDVGMGDALWPILQNVRARVFGRSQERKRETAES